LGQVNTLTDAQLSLAKFDSHPSEFTPNPPGSRERELRQVIVEMVHRAYDRQLMTSTQGAASARLDGQDFLITPGSIDRHLVDTDDIVLIQNGDAETGKRPSRLARLHQEIYSGHPDVNFIMTAQPPNIMAYAVTSIPFNTRTMFESYYLLRDIPVVPYGMQYQDPLHVAEIVPAKNPVVLIQNACVVTTGQTILQAFDRLEVAEASAKILIDTDSIGPFVSLTDEQIQQVDIAFSL
jgi:L-fuculose-phosphate aldolase